MYGGLFGDLPAAKGESTKDENDNSSRTKELSEGADVTDATNEVSNPKASQDDSQASNKNKEPSTMMFLPPAASRKKAKTTPASSSGATGSSFSQSIGAAGTSMAFVPSTVKRKAKRPSRFAKVVETPKVSPPVAATRSTDAISRSASVDAKAPSVTSKISTPSATIHTSLSNAMPFQGGTTTTAHASSGPIDIHAPSDQAPTNKSTPGSLQQNLSSTFPWPDSTVHDDDEGEHPSEITDPYDPYVPNDLLQYWDRQAMVQEQVKLEEETRKALEQQKMIREQLEQERQALQQQGNLSQLAASGMGRGRGRGMSNLPAWLVAKQQQEDGAAQQRPEGADTLGGSSLG